MGRKEHFVSAALFHGTDAVFKPGDLVLPGAKTGRSNFKSGDPVAYASNDIGVAKFFGEESAFNASEAHGKSIPDRIYKVAPVNPSDVS